MPIGSRIIKMQALNSETKKEIIDFGVRKGYIIEILEGDWFLAYFKSDKEMSDFAMYLQVLKNPN